MQSFVIVDIGSHTAKAGLADHTQPPQVVITSAVGYKSVKSYTDGALSNGFVGNNASEQEKSKESRFENLAEYIPLCGDYIAHEKKVDPSSVIEMRSPIRDGIIVDWTALGSLCKHILVRELSIQRAQNSSGLLLSYPSHWTKSELEMITQMMFESLNVPGLALIERPLLCVYACGVPTGLVLDFGHDIFEVSPVVESSILRLANLSTSIGGRDVQNLLCKLIPQDKILLDSLVAAEIDVSDHETLAELAKTIRESSACEIRRVPMDTASTLRLVDGPDEQRFEFMFRGKLFTVGSIRYRCMEALFDSALLDPPSKDVIRIPELIQVAVHQVPDPDKRLQLWENTLITGGLSLVTGLRERLEYEIAPLIAASETSHETQPKELKFLKIPEYFTAYKEVKGPETDQNRTERPQDVAYLGGCIVARMLMADRNYISKGDYNEVGPAIAHLKESR
ncbi:actin family [Cladochytrium replicatum]|nr:actin family [Cladochytrium replicatum]